MYSRTVSTQYPRTGHVTRKPAKPAAETTEQITPAFTTRGAWRWCGLTLAGSLTQSNTDSDTTLAAGTPAPDSVVHRTHTNLYITVAILF